MSRRFLLTREFLGDTYLEEGNAQAALDHYEAIWPTAMALVPKGDIVAELRRRRAEAFLLLGRTEEAYDEARKAIDHCRELGDRYEEAATYRTLGQAAAALGRPSEAREWFDQGFAYYDDIETPYEWGKLWLAYGDWLSGPHAGEYADGTSAREAYGFAHDLFARMGAEGKLAEVQGRLTRMGVAKTAVSTSEPALSGDSARLVRRPRASTELDRRSAWARETFQFVTRNRIVLDLLDDVAKLAKSGSPILILGESGTGKELVASGIHRLSARSGAYTPINCGALPRDVIESEMFGHMAGAFTGATRDKTGLFESCAGGTVFLDEVGEMSVELQAKLLRFLETGEFRRVGATRNVRVDTLVVAATNRERAALEQGTGFRSDLYYRLAHAVVTLPPVRRRGDDVDLLVLHFLAAACERYGKNVRLSAVAHARLLGHPWPGNVREMRSALNRLVILAAPDSEIPGDAVELSQSGAPTSLNEELEQAERRRIAEALTQTNGVRSEAARSLGMSRTTFLGKMKRYGIS